ncbi:MAG: DUF6377 domain-containing protein [Candidatus Saccharimonadaceae bacterium]
MLSSHAFGFSENSDSLLNVLDKVILERETYLYNKEAKISGYKQEKKFSKDTVELININWNIIQEYSSFICDSAEYYTKENLLLAKGVNNEEVQTECLLQLSYFYSLSGLFLQANEIFEQLDYDNLSDNHKARYCWTHIRYFENLIFYTNDSRYSKQYEEQKEAYRDKVLGLLEEGSEEYNKELIHKLQSEGSFTLAEDLLLSIFHDQKPSTHDYAMTAMNLAKFYDLVDNYDLEEYYLLVAAITDIELAVKENEALLSLAVNLYENGDIVRPYKYIKVALDDALFYNARFKNSVIARVQPIIEDAYLQKIYSQQKNLRYYSILTSLFALVLIITLFYLYLQVKAVSKVRKELWIMNKNLLQLNRNLDEANTVKEHYIGYFMNQCSVYINKLDKFRKNVKLNIKTGQIINIFKLSGDELEKNITELHFNFDKAFLALYPNFVIEFNSLLKPGEEYSTELGELNNELRIFALIKLGITDVKQIADFLHYSIQTVYNYRSKVKGKAVTKGDQFEKMIIKIGRKN